MTRCQNNRICSEPVTICCLNFSYFFPVLRPAGHFLIEMNFTSAFDNIIAHSADDTRKFIGPDMGMGFVKNFFFGAKSDKEIQDTLDITSFVTPCI